MELETFVDRSGYIHCPRCIGENLRYQVIPSPRIESADPVNTLTIHCDDLRDYTCKDCDATWLIADNECGKEF